MSLAQLWTALVAARWSILAMVLVASGVAFGVASQIPRQYTAKARVMLNIDNSDPNQFSALQKNTQGIYIATEIKLVSDLAVMRNAVTKLGWPDNPQVIAAWQDATGGTGDVASWAAGTLGQGVAARQLEDSSIIEIYYTSSSLDAAKQIVAVIRTAFMEQSGTTRADAARRASMWNQQQAARALAQLKAAEAKRVAFMATNRIAVDTPAGGLDYLEHSAALANDRVPRAVQMAPGPVTSVAMQALKRRLDDIEAQLAVARLRGDENPATVALLTQRGVVSDQLARETALAGGAVPEALSGRIRQQHDEDYLQARLRLLQRMPMYDQLAAMNRDIALKTQLYDRLAAHVANFDEVAAAPTGLNVIGDVIADDTATYPNIPLMVGIAAGASFALAFALALLGELTRGQVRTTEDLGFSAKVPVLAVIAPTPHRSRSWRRLPRRLLGAAGWRPSAHA